MQHDFHTCLERSFSYADASWWEEVYKSAFPDFAGMVSVRADGWAQRGGIDRVITMHSGKTITVDEKVREIKYPDIILEIWSDKERKVKGWIQKDLACDYIAYAFAPTRECYLLPFLMLRKTWRDNGRAWISEYRRVLAQNNGYVTESLAVPTSVLLTEVSNSMRVVWGQSK